MGQMLISDETRAVLEIELEEILQEREELMEDYRAGYYAYDDAREREQMLTVLIQDIMVTLGR